MKTVWVAGMNDAEKEIFKHQFSQSKIVLDKLHEIVYNMLKGRQDVDTPDYASPSWSHLQAHKNGACEMARQILELVKTEPKPHK